MKRKMLKHVGVCLLAVLILAATAGCGAGRSAYMLSDGWIVRSDGANTGEDEDWYKGFKDDGGSWDPPAGTIMFCNTFTASFNAGADERIILSLTDIGSNVSIWLNGKSAGEQIDACGNLSIDVTDSVKKSGNNVLVLKKMGAGAGAVEHTSIAVRPQVLISDTYVSTDIETGKVTFRITLDNAAAETKQADIEVMLTAYDTGKVLSRIASTVSAPAGESVQTVEAAIDSPIGWNTVKPYLYNAQVRVESGGKEDFSSVSVGFRDFAVDAEGFFRLDGERFMLKAADIPEETMYDEGAMRKFIDFVRTCGFNAVRPVSGTATQALLSYCDKAGMLVENRVDAAGIDTVADIAARTARAARNHVSFATLELHTQAGTPGAADAAGALAAIRAQCADVAVFCGGAVSDATAEIPVSNADSDNFDARIGAGGAAYMTICADRVFPENVDADALEMWYEETGLDRVYSSVAEAYAAAQKQYVAQAEAKICRLRGTTALSGIHFAGPVAGYPQSMLDVFNDSINDLRFCIEADEAVYAGKGFNLNIGLSNYNVLWNAPFSAYIKITGAAGIVYEKTVTFTPQVDADGWGEQVITLLDEDITLNVPTGEYTIAAEFVNLAHPTCGDRTLYIIHEDDLPELTGTVYTYGVSDAVKGLIGARGAAVTDFAAGLPDGAVIVAAGEIPESVYAAAKDGARLIALGVSQDSGLPVEGAFVTGVGGVFASNRIAAPFAGKALVDALGFVPDGAFNGGECETLLSAFGFAADGKIFYGTWIGTYEYGSGRVCVCLPDLNAAAGSAGADILLLSAMAAVG